MPALYVTNFLISFLFKSNIAASNIYNGSLTIFLIELKKNILIPSNKFVYRIRKCPTTKFETDLACAKGGSEQEPVVSKSLTFFNLPIKII